MKQKKNYTKWKKKKKNEKETDTLLLQILIE